jgi:hypothetical protein
MFTASDIYTILGISAVARKDAKIPILQMLSRSSMSETCKQRKKLKEQLQLVKAHHDSVDWVETRKREEQLAMGRVWQIMRKSRRLVEGWLGMRRSIAG